MQSVKARLNFGPTTAAFAAAAAADPLAAEDPLAAAIVATVRLRGEAIS